LRQASRQAYRNECDDQRGKTISVHKKASYLVILVAVRSGDERNPAKTASNRQHFMKHELYKVVHGDRTKPHRMVTIASP
jgi:hypothetical protein